MPEYLSPGVYIEELPPQLRAIEGVSTSTAGFVGPAERGPVPGFPLPFQPTGGFVLPLDPALVLVTSLADFVRQFGNVLPLPTPVDSEDNGYLAYAVRAFFANGGKRCYISRIVSSSGTRSTVRLGQGVVSLLARPARKGDVEIVLTSLRGLNVGDTLSFRRRADDADLLSGSSGAAVITGTVAAPYLLSVTDQFGVSVNGGAPVNMTPVNANRATVTTPVGPFTLNGGETLQLRVGAAAQPVQTVTFQAADITVGAATAAEVAAVLNRQLIGVQVFVAGNAVTIRTDQQGSGARIEVIGGNAAAVLGLAVGATAGTGNVADSNNVSVGEIIALFAPVGFNLSDDGASHLRISSVGVGSSSSIQVVDTIPGTAAKLGFSTAQQNGTDPVAAAVPTVNSYDTRRNSVTLNAALGLDLDPDDVYLLRGGTTPTANGPMFFARTPGSWSADVGITLISSDRSAIPVTAAAPGSATSVQVQSTRSFYRGAIVEVDHTSQRTYHEVEDIVGNSLQLANPLGQPVTVASAAQAGSFVRVVEIDVIIEDGSGASPTETYKGLSWNQGPLADLEHHYATQINARSQLVFVQPPGTGNPALSPPGSEDATLASQPTTANGFAQLMTSVGNDGLPASGAAGDADYVGVDPGPGGRTGIAALQDGESISIIAAPGKTTPTVQLALVDQCELMRYRFAVLDGEAEPLDGSVTSIRAHRSIFDTSYAAYYSPWPAVTIGDQVAYLPPSGYVCGIYARTDNDRGVWKAPANEVVLNVVGLRFYFTTGEQDILNPIGVNLIRRFDTLGIRVWGARTLSSDADVKYVNVRRTLIYLEASIDRGTQWVVFEPNTPDTWDRVTDSVSAFLMTQWRNGALFGLKPSDAFFVRCDETTMTADDIQNGRLICQIGVAIVRPAEFVIFRIEQITGFANQ